MLAIMPQCPDGSDDVITCFVIIVMMFYGSHAKLYVFGVSFKNDFSVGKSSRVGHWLNGSKNKSPNAGST